MRIFSRQEDQAWLLMTFPPRRLKQSLTKSKRVCPRSNTERAALTDVAGGKAAAAPGSVADGQKIIDAAVKAFGTVHILINNAGIIRQSIPRAVTLVSRSGPDYWQGTRQ